MVNGHGNDSDDFQSRSAHNYVFAFLFLMVDHLLCPDMDNPSQCVDKHMIAQPLGIRQ